MDAKEAQKHMDILYPVGGFRWFNLEITDQEKAIKYLSCMGPDMSEECGFKCQAIAIVDHLDFQYQVLDDIEKFVREKKEEIKSQKHARGE
jgi:hypothetical protein